MKKVLAWTAAIAAMALMAVILWEAVFPFIGFVLEKMFAVPA